MERSSKLQSPIWAYFIKKDMSMATCKICYNDYSYRSSVSNLSKHYIKKHGKLADLPDVSSDDSEGEEKNSSKLQSPIWSYFIRKDLNMATCKTCHNDYSYRTSLTNLKKHYIKKHGKLPDLSDVSSDDDDSDGEQEQEKNSDNKNAPNATWNYYEVLDSDKFEANCKLCGTTVPYESVSDLRKHVRDHGELTKDSDDEAATVAQKKKARKFKSWLWQYFKVVDTEATMAMCVFCNRMFNYGSTISNLGRHLKRKHKAVIKRDDDSKKLIISSNGQLYEVETGPAKEEYDDDNDKDPIEMDTVYLEDFEDSIDQLPVIKPSPQKKKISIPPKRHFSKISTEQVQSSRNTCSEDELPSKRISSNTMGSLDYFGQYVVSLLRELPKPVSDQLQSEIIKQILTSKMALETQTSAKYAITISPNNVNQTNIPEPVAYTVIKSKDVPEKLNEVTTESLEHE